MKRRHPEGWAPPASLLALIFLVPLWPSPTHADIIPPDIDALRRNGPSTSCPAGTESSPLENVDCVPRGTCATTADCGEAGPCGEVGLCLAPEQDGVRPVLGACVDGACVFGECETARRCRGSRQAEVGRATREVEEMLLLALRESDGVAPTPMANPNAEVPDSPPPPEVPSAEPARPRLSGGCGCRVSAGPPDATSPLVLSLLFGLVILPMRRRRAPA